VREPDYRAEPPRSTPGRSTTRGRAGIRRGDRGGCRPSRCVSTRGCGHAAVPGRVRPGRGRLPGGNPPGGASTQNGPPTWWVPYVSSGGSPHQDPRSAPSTGGPLDLDAARHGIMRDTDPLSNPRRLCEEWVPHAGHACSLPRRWCIPRPRPDEQPGRGPFFLCRTTASPYTMPYCRRHRRRPRQGGRPPEASAGAKHRRVGRTRLWWAVRRRWWPVVRALLERGADVNATEVNGWTTLMWAAFNRDVAVQRPC